MLGLENYHWILLGLKPILSVPGPASCPKDEPPYPDAEPSLQQFPFWVQEQGKS